MNGPLTVEHEPARGRFVARVEATECELRYRLDGQMMTIFHTGVPPALEGRGIAAQLVAAALAHARSAGWRVQPTCGYVRAYMRRHPATKDLLA